MTSKFIIESLSGSPMAWAASIHAKIREGLPNAECGPIAMMGSQARFALKPDRRSPGTQIIAIQVEVHDSPSKVESCPPDPNLETIKEIWARIDEAMPETPQLDNLCREMDRALGMDSGDPSAY